MRGRVVERWGKATTGYPLSRVVVVLAGAWNIAVSGQSVTSLGDGDGGATHDHTAWALWSP